MRLFLFFFPFLIAILSSELAKGSETDKTVLLAILARNKAHVLPYFLNCIDNLEYDKKKVTIYINTNNNQDATQELLETWINKKGKAYREVIYEPHEIRELPPCSPHVWTSQRFKLLGQIRNRSMKMALATTSDFYFVVDCDNFIVPSTLCDLVASDKPIIAPMLRTIVNPRRPYSNFFSEVDFNGYRIESNNEFLILNREITGVFQVPVVHCTYLVKTSCIPELTYVDESDDHEFIIFSRRARERGIHQFISNEKPFGYLLDPSKKTLEEEQCLIADIPALQTPDFSVFFDPLFNRKTTWKSEENSRQENKP